jgi:Na+/H+ antiporter NhaD/arsenite permease-like protein
VRRPKVRSHTDEGSPAPLRVDTRPRRRRNRGVAALRCAIAVASAPLFAATAHAAQPAALNGAALSPLWIVPFIGMLLSIAVMPLTAPGFWHAHFGKASAFWATAFVVPFSMSFGPDLAFREIAHTLFLEYLPFVILLLSLYTVAGGIHIRGRIRATPATNTAMLGLGTGLASVMGTTGAAMLLVRPLLRANEGRRHKAPHVVVFFIFLVANIGGGLTPLGDPPIFLGFLKGVDFFWTTRNLLAPTLLASTLLLAVFYAIDRWHFARHEVREAPRDATHDSPLAVEGGINLLLLVAILACVLVSGSWKPGVEIVVLGTAIELQNLARDAALLSIAWLSWRVTPRALRRAHHFDWAPMIEVAKLFAAIFLTIIPAIAILRAGNSGEFAPVVALVSHPSGAPDNMLYFWLTGLLSSVLDNAPTYLVFFNLAGGDAAALMGPLANTLVAVSAGAVFMGAMTYIGNAPNFMVKSIAEARGVRMPGFLAYVGWSTAFLLPTFALVNLLFLS